MKIFVTGVAGQLGHDVMNELHARGMEGIGSDLHKTLNVPDDGTPVFRMPYVPMDITDAESVRRVISEAAPDAVIHCAAWTAVDAAEENEALVRRVNADGPKFIAEICQELDIPMMYFSTDYVFDGQGEAPHKPEEPYAPLGIYGHTKMEGELAVMAELEKFFILRIAWVFGTNGKNFIKTMLSLAETHDTLTVVDDQIGTPTYTYDLARLVVDMIQTEKYGIYHVTNEGPYISWYDFARAIFETAGIDTVQVLPVSSEEYGAKAVRPMNSRMDRTRITEEGFVPLPDWQDALSRYLQILKENDA